MIECATDVASALAEGAAVVALESSIIAHGLPHPANQETALALEAAIRELGAVPATIGVIDGVARIGMSRADIERLASPEHQVAKAGMRDLAALMTGKRTAGTTVSGTAVLAARVGIRCFATGGIGGVHRGDSGDISSDLHALSTTAIAVVCSGPKSILDVPRTAEALESLGVPVIGYRCDVLPGFYSRGSRVELEHRVEHASEAAALVRAHTAALGQGGIVIANPVPAADEIPEATLEPVIARALAAAGKAGVAAKALTPFLLAELQRELGSRATTCNQALVLSNARLAAAIAVELSAA